MSTLFQEFKRRNVIRVAVAYAVMSWLVLQVADMAVPALHLPEWVNSLIFLLLVLGFVPVLVFAWAFELTPEGIKLQKEVDRDRSITRETGKKLNHITLAALALVVVFVIGERFLFPPASAPVEETLASGEVSIAVLPFTDMSPNRDQDYFSDGISEEILNGLAKLKTMKVAGRTSSFAFKGRNEDLREIGSALGVQHVLEGSVRKDGDQLRITAQLIKVSDGFHLWSETYDRELQDVFAVQDEISAAIVKELRGNLLGDEVPVSQTHQVGIAVYEKYLAARKKIVTRSNANLLEARAILEEIIAIEPDFPPALSSLAETLMLLRRDSFFAYGDLDPQEARRLATPLLDHAIEIDPNFADAFAVRGLMRYSDRKWDEAETALLRAVELNPSLSNAWTWLGNTAAAQQREDESIDYYAEATAIDPLWLVPNSNLVRQYSDLGRIDDARAIIDRLRPFHQDSANFHSTDGELKRGAGQLAEALRAYRTAYALAPDTPSISSQTAFTLLRLQEFEEALEIVPPQFALMKNYVSGEWDDTLLELRDHLDQDPLDFIPLFGYLNGSNYVGNFESVVDFYDEHIESPSTITAAGVYDILLKFVPAMDALDRHKERDELLAAYKLFLDNGVMRGIVSADLDEDWASYFAMVGDFDGSLEKLQEAFDKGSRWGAWVYDTEFYPMADDPRFIALKQQNLDAINAERAMLGWAPVAKVREIIQ
ncbi:MAG: tetratricopeptide repeat protein [Gammaproteobacteria bacterium]|nr:tetratricopeptide repeat protein [Gammaproteobacteria bacterium]MDH3416080.1 tetratricopeptide repeat protein [Gammaproteobacteria bacterium]